MSLWEDYDQDFDRDDEQQSITCKRCGKQDLTWGQQSNQWRLFENGKLHKCVTTEEAFDDET